MGRHLRFGPMSLQLQSPSGDRVCWQPGGYKLERVFDRSHCAEGHKISYTAFMVASDQTHLGVPVAPTK